MDDSDERDRPVVNRAIVVNRPAIELRPSKETTATDLKAKQPPTVKVEDSRTDLGPVVELIPSPGNGTVIILMGGGTEAKILSTSLPLRQDAERVVLAVPHRRDGSPDLEGLREVIADHVRDFFVDPDNKREPEHDDEVVIIPDEETDSVTVIIGAFRTKIHSPLPLRSGLQELRIRIPVDPQTGQASMEMLKAVISQKIRELVVKEADGHEEVTTVSEGTEDDENEEISSSGKKTG